MIYRFIVLSDEVEDFAREISIDADSTFLQLNDAILDSVGYSHDQMTSIFVTNENWEKKAEFTLMDMGSDFDDDSYVMSESVLRDQNFDKGQRLLFEYDNISGRVFFLELKEIVLGKNLDKPECTYSEGDAPAQLMDIDDFDAKVVKGGAAKTDDFIDDAFAGGEEGFNDDELDDESFSYGDFSEDM